MVNFVETVAPLKEISQDTVMQMESVKFVICIIWVAVSLFV